MRFSIIIPVYNVEQYICECIDSVINQTHQDMEIILVDDGSTDASGKICDQYALQYQGTVTVIHNKNQGPHRARMCGIETATGDAVLFIDSDDFIRFDTLELLNSKFENTACDMILFNSSKEKNFNNSYLKIPFKDGQCFSGDRKTELFEELIFTSNLNSLCLKAIKKELLSSIPKEYMNFSGHNGEDLLLSLPLVTSAENIVYLAQNLYYYRSRPESIVHSYNPERYRSIKTVHIEMEKYIDKWDMGAYHALHYAREVRGWVECLKQLLMSTMQPNKNLLDVLAEDDYFLKAYMNMEHSALSRIDTLLGKWLYKKKYDYIMLAGILLRIEKTVKRLLRGSEYR